MRAVIGHCPRVRVPVFTDYADLRRVDFTGASLRRASFLLSKLQGASLDGAHLQGASLYLAHLQGASLDRAQLQGASLYRAHLQGASLDRAQLQGTNLERAALRQTALSSAAVWRARNADCGDARVQGSKYDPIIQVDLDEPNRSFHATPEATAKFIDDAVIGIAGPKMKQQAIARLRAGLVVDPAKDDTARIESHWRACEDSSGKVPEAEYSKKRAAFLRNLVCDAELPEPAIAKGIIRNWISRTEDRGEFYAQLARGLLGEDGKTCVATKDLDENDKKLLRAAAPADRTTTPAPAPSP